MGENEKPLTTENISLDVSKDNEDNVRTMVKKEAWASLVRATVLEQWKRNAHRPGTRCQSIQVPTIPCGSKGPRDRGRGSRQIAEGRRHWAFYVRVGRPSALFTGKDGRLRFCRDWRKLNSMTVKDTYHLLIMDDCIDTLREAQYCTNLDEKSFYCTMNIRK